MARAVAATGAPGQREAEGECRIVDGVTSSVESVTQRSHHARIGWIGVVFKRGIHFCCRHSNELQWLPTRRWSAKQHTEPRELKENVPGELLVAQFPK